MNMDKNETRRGNLWLLRQTLGKGAVNEIAEKADTNPSYLSTIFNGQRELGDELAERIETAFNKPKGWLDISPDVGIKESAASYSNVDLDLIKQVIEEVFSRSLALPPSDTAELCISIYQYLKDEEVPSQNATAQIIKLADIFGKTA